METESFDDIEQTCKVIFNDSDELNLLKAALGFEADRVKAHIEDPEVETDDVDDAKENKFRSFLQKVNDGTLTGNELETVSKQEVQSWISAVNQYKQKNIDTLTEDEKTDADNIITKLDATLIEIDRHT